MPGQFQSRYYTVRSWDGAELVLDVVVHDVGLVTEWASGECVGDQVTITEPKGSFAMPEGCRAAGCCSSATSPRCRRWPGSRRPTPARCRPGSGPRCPTCPELGGYLPDGADVDLARSCAEHASRLAAVVEEIDWPEGDGYFWMAGESAQMRAIRKFLMRERRLPSTAYDVMGYWRAVVARQPRPVDPGPIWRAGKAAGKSDDEIWADYDRASQEQVQQ